MRNPEIWIGLIILGFLLFGAKKMPDAARGLGRSLRIFKSEIKGMQDDENAQQQPQQQGQLVGGYPPAPGQPIYQQAPAQPVYQPQPVPPGYQPQPVPPGYQPSPTTDPAQAEHRETP